MEEGGVILPFYEIKCPYCNFIFFIEVSKVGFSLAFFCHRCRQRIASEHVD